MPATEIAMLDPVTDPRWDAYVEQHPEGWVYHLAAWQRILRSSFGHIHGQCVVLLNKESQRIVGGLPLYRVNTWLTGRRLVSIPFGTLATPLADNPADIPILIEAAVALCRRSHCKQLEIRSMHALTDTAAASLSADDSFCSHVTRLDGPLDTLYHSFHRSCVRQRIQRAETSGVTLYRGETESDVLRFYELYLITRKRVGRPAQPLRMIQAVWRELQPAGRCELLFACKGSTTLASILILRYKNRASAEWAASDEQYRNLGPNQFLFWQALKSAHAAGCTTFDFGRTSRSNEGLMEFKSHWATTVSSAYRYCYPPCTQGKKSGLHETITSLAVHACKSMPRFLQRPFGELVYNYKW